MRKIKLDAKAVSKINKRNRHGKPWRHESGEDIKADYIVKCYDLYKQGKITTRKLFSLFPGRTMASIQSKVWKIRGKADKEDIYNPDQTNLFMNLLE